MKQFTDEELKAYEQQKVLCYSHIRKIIALGIELVQIQKQPITTSNVIDALEKAIGCLRYNALQANPEDFLEKITYVPRNLP